MVVGVNGCANNFLLIVVGMLKGFDQLMNLVLDDVQEVMRGESFLLR